MQETTSNQSSSATESIIRHVLTHANFSGPPASWSMNEGATKVLSSLTFPSPSAPKSMALHEKSKTLAVGLSSSQVQLFRKDRGQDWRLLHTINLKDSIPSQVISQDFNFHFKVGHLEFNPSGKKLLAFVPSRIKASPGTLDIKGKPLDELFTPALTFLIDLKTDDQGSLTSQTEYLKDQSIVQNMNHFSVDEEAIILLDKQEIKKTKDDTDEDSEQEGDVSEQVDRNEGEEDEDEGRIEYENKLSVFSLRHEDYLSKKFQPGLSAEWYEQTLDGKYILTYSDCEVRVWDAKTRKLKATLSGDVGTKELGMTSSDSKVLVVLSHKQPNYKIHAFNLETFKREFSINLGQHKSSGGFMDCITSVTMDKKMKYLVIGDHRGRVKVYDLNSRIMVPGPIPTFKEKSLNCLHEFKFNPKISTSPSESKESRIPTFSPNQDYPIDYIEFNQDGTKVAFSCFSIEGEEIVVYDLEKNLLETLSCPLKKVENPWIEGGTGDRIWRSDAKEGSSFLWTKDRDEGGQELECLISRGNEIEIRCWK